MYEQFANVAISSLADAEKLPLASGRVRARHQAQPSSYVAGFRLPSTADRRQKCGAPMNEPLGSAASPR